LQPEVQGKCHWCAHWTFKLRGATTPDSGSGLSTSQARPTLSVPPLGADPEVTVSRSPIMGPILDLAGNRGRNLDLGRSPDSRFGQNRLVPDSAAGNGNRGPDWPEIGKSGITPSRVSPFDEYRRSDPGPARPWARCCLESFEAYGGLPADSGLSRHRGR
jgi:hypothetical protein